MQSVPTYLLVSVLLITLVVLAIFRSVVLPLRLLVLHSPESPIPLSLGKKP